MTIRISMAAVLVATSVAAIGARSQSQTTGVVAGRIISVHCEARLIKKDMKVDTTLTAPRDIALGLAAGDQLQCVKEGYLEVLVWNGTKTVKASKQPFTVPPLPQDPIDAKQDVLIASALAGYGVSGATRGGAADSRILWPSDGSAVAPEHFVIRWSPVRQKIVLSVMSEAKDVTLWGPAETDGEPGELKSAAIASALAAYGKASASPRLILTLTLANASDWEEVNFSFLTGREEQELDTQLDYWAKHTDGLALRLGRGDTFARHKLFAEAAEEYDSALSSAPESRYLLEDAIQANRWAGRASRVKELQIRLASLPAATNP